MAPTSVVSVAGVTVGSMPEETRNGRRLARQALPFLVAVAALTALVLVVNPRALAAALARFNPLALPLVVGLTAGWFLVQGLRWHLLLRAVGGSLRALDSVLVSLAGQVVTALLPLGDLTRAVLAAEAAGLDVGTTAATVTVQELTFTLCLVLLAAPGMLSLGVGTGVVAAVTAGVAAILAILLVPGLYRPVRRATARLPLPGRLLGQVDLLQAQAARLLRRPDTLAGSLLDLARAALGVTALWLIV